ncbi:iron/ascorbate oxidoreductase [Acrasis kona]|uniref:Iron/ascorbate oxidoreductase n=1 Tax=Acrasis kona TaxID=1008807 RepID=A0AAW2ZDG9_9EUKA
MSIPVVDLSSLQKQDISEAELKKVASELCTVFETVGFAYLKNHGVPYTTKEIMNESKHFFGLDQENKKNLARKNFEGGNKNTYRGYFPLQKGDPSYKEGFEIGPYSSQEEADKNKRNQQQSEFDLEEVNVWPSEERLPGFNHFAIDLYKSCRALGSRIMKLVAVYYNLPHDFFESFFEPSLSTLRLLHYPKRVGSGSTFLSEDDKIPLSCAAHTDSGIITILFQDDAGGLQVKDSTSNWVDVTPIENTIIINLGDLLSKWTNGRFVSTLHRVKATPADRYSVPFFFEPSFDAVIQPLSVCLSEGETPKMQPIQYGTHVCSKMDTWVEYRGGVEVEYL